LASEFRQKIFKMKKTIFTICSVALVCCAVIMSCNKDDYNGTQVGYASQPGYGGGNNPNPNGLPYTTPTVATTSTTPTPTVATTNTTTTNFTVDGTSESNPTASGAANGGNFVVLGASGSVIIQLTFPGTSAPATGTYNITSGTPTGNECGFILTDGGSFSAASGVVNVTAAASPSNTATFSSILCSGSSAHTVSGTIKY
jgi:hypothetical protein